MGIATGIKNTAGGLGAGLMHLLFPNLCEGCRQPLVRGEDVICLACETELPYTNYHHIKDNETALRLSGRIPFEHASSLLRFADDNLVQHLVHGLKYRNKKQNGIFLGRKLGQAIIASNWQPDAVVPVPLHVKKEHARGYNQSQLVAEGIAEILKVPVAFKSVERTRNTSSQTDKSRAERIENVEGAFRVRKPEQLRDKHILLVDDVLTTGATLEACAQSLLAIPGIRISFVTVAIAN